MIIALIGGIGSGKTLSAVRTIKQDNTYPLTNFKLKNVTHHRLKYSDIIEEKTEEQGKRTIKSHRVNWEFWDALRKNKKHYSIYLDEAHNIIHSRASMSKKNVLMSKWISQIRKVLSDSPTNHIYIITQTPRRIDINFRELTQVVIECTLVKIKERVWVVQKFYEGFDGYSFGTHKAMNYFLANPYFKYYNTNEMVQFGDAEEFV